MTHIVCRPFGFGLWRRPEQQQQGYALLMGHLSPDILPPRVADVVWQYAGRLQYVERPKRCACGQQHGPPDAASVAGTKPPVLADLYFKYDRLRPFFHRVLDVVFDDTDLTMSVGRRLCRAAGVEQLDDELFGDLSTIRSLAARLCKSGLEMHVTLYSNGSCFASLELVVPVTINGATFWCMATADARHFPFVAQVDRGQAWHRAQTSKLFDLATEQWLPWHGVGSHPWFILMQGLRAPTVFSTYMLSHSVQCRWDVADGCMYEFQGLDRLLLQLRQPLGDEVAESSMNASFYWIMLANNIESAWSRSLYHQPEFANAFFGAYGRT